MVSGPAFVNDGKQQVIVIEQATNCHVHKWHTVLQEDKYSHFSDSMKGHIYDRNPNLCVMVNQVPERFIFSDNYMQLHQPIDNVCEISPRLWAFEISTVLTRTGKDEKGEHKHEEIDILLYSKLMCRVWPHFADVSNKIARMFEEFENGVWPSELREKYQFKGQVQVVPRGHS